ncbi:cytochrome b-c1 complex subunit 2, mitochondrial [Culicoides brevitarsis]|uniref:cytochrome b-c1 complex subunit 2, mitochondrial n=1 Tax=Culicoides brevitarsis TaxID=469753 RepID=UPI00307B7D90
MACNASKTPLLRHLTKRGFAHAAPAQAHGARKSGEIHTTTLPSKMVVASCESNSPVSRVSIVFRAGSRNETSDSLGATHLLRIAAGLSTKNATGFAITRNLQEVGGNLSCTTDRELVAYNVEVTRNHLETGLKFLEAAVTGQVFKPWELADNAKRVKEDIKRISDCVKALELVHEASFDGGLGNSIFCPKHKAGKLSSETLQHYFASTCTANRCAVVGINVDHQQLVGYAQSLGLDSGAGPDSVSKHVGPSEIRWEKGGNVASVAVAAEGVGWKNQKEALAHLVLQYAAGVGPHTKYGANNGALTKQVTGCASVKTLNACYSDTGLFGFVVSGEAKAVGQAVETGVKTMKSCSVSDDDIKRGKEALKAAVAFAMESEAGLVDCMGQQAGTLGTVQSLAETCAAIDGVSASDVKSAARNLQTKKVSVGAVGNLSHVPRVNQLN